MKISQIVPLYEGVMPVELCMVLSHIHEFGITNGIDYTILTNLIIARDNGDFSHKFRPTDLNSTSQQGNADVVERVKSMSMPEIKKLAGEFLDIMAQLEKDEENEECAKKANEDMSKKKIAQE